MMESAPSASPRAKIAVLAATGAVLLAGAIAFSARAGQEWGATVVKAAEPAGPRTAKRARAGPKPVPARPWGADVLVVPAPALGGKPQAPAEAASVLAPPEAAASNLETGAAAQSPARDYCANIATAAADARFLRQQKAIAELEQELGRRIATLEEKTAEYRKWLARRDEFSQRASEGLLKIYARMRPDAAAAQLAALDEETAAALITKLDSRISSLILNEMEAAKAARITSIISGAAKVPPEGRAEAKERRS